MRPTTVQYFMAFLYQNFWGKNYELLKSKVFICQQNMRNSVIVTWRNFQF